MAISAWWVDNQAKNSSYARIGNWPWLLWEVKLPLYNVGKGIHLGNSCASLSSTYRKWAPVATSACPGHDSKGLRLLGCEVWVTPSGKHPRRTEMLTEGDGNLEWVVGEEDAYQL